VTVRAYGRCCFAQRARRSSSAGRTIVPPSRRPSQISDFAWAIASVEPSRSMCAVPALTTSATSGSASFVRYSISPRPRIPNSTTPN